MLYRYLDLLQKKFQKVALNIPCTYYTTMSSVPEGVCEEDCVVVDSVLEDWLELDSNAQKRSAGGWEPMWGMDGVFNGCLQQGDCGYTMCSVACAKLASTFLNKVSKQYIETKCHRDTHGCIRGACLEGFESCGWCIIYTAAQSPCSTDGNDGIQQVCDTCGCSYQSHEVVHTAEEAAQLGFKGMPHQFISSTGWK